MSVYNKSCVSISLRGTELWVGSRGVDAAGCWSGGKQTHKQTNKETYKTHYLNWS